MLQFQAMGTTVTVDMPSLPPRDEEERVRAIAAHFELREQCFSRFRPESELSQLHRVQSAVVSEVMFDALVSAQAFHKGTSGLFDPAIGTALVALGYDRSMHEGSLDRLEEHGVSRFSTFGELSLEAAHRRVHRPSHVTIDLGGLIKGRTVDEAAAFLPECGVIDAGGDIAVRGSSPDGQGWLVDVEDPFDASHTLTTLRVHDRAIATSAANRRRWRVGARMVHHLIDPRTQAPAETDLAQVTVLASSAELAEVLAKTFFLLGLEGARMALASLPTVGAVLVDVHGHVALVGSVTEAAEAHHA